MLPWDARFCPAVRLRRTVLPPMWLCDYNVTICDYNVTIMELSGVDIHIPILCRYTYTYIDIHVLILCRYTYTYIVSIYVYLSCVDIHIPVFCWYTYTYRVSIYIYLSCVDIHMPIVCRYPYTYHGFAPPLGWDARFCPQCDYVTIMWL